MSLGIYQVYLIKNKINHKMYIGCTTTSLNKRLNVHYHHALIKNSHFPIHRAIRKYGKENFDVSIIETYLNEQSMLQGEINWIAYFDTYNSSNGYNATLGGESVMLGRHHTKETKTKISENHQDYTGANNPNFGKKHSEETIKKMSEAHKGNQSLKGKTWKLVGGKRIYSENRGLK